MLLAVRVSHSLLELWGQERPGSQGGIVMYALFIGFSKIKTAPLLGAHYL